jgi:hypothetical protein
MLDTLELNSFPSIGLILYESNRLVIMFKQIAALHSIIKLAVFREL